MTFTVTKQGQEIQFESAFSDIQIAKYYLQENLQYNTFAQDLTNKSKLSDKQVAWIHYLATEHLKKELDNETPKQGEYYDLVTKMYSAGNKLNKFQVRLPGVTISTVSKGQNTGCLYVFEDNNYVGKINHQGQLIGSASEDVKNILLDANDNLLKLAQLYGHQTGNCSICNRTLSDPISIKQGIGPVCAKKLS